MTPWFSAATRLLSARGHVQTVDGKSSVSGKAQLRVVLAGEEPVKSAPSLSLAQALRSQGIDVAFSNGAESVSTSSWISAVRKSDVIVCVAYHGPDLYLVKQLALAVALGRPAIRWWVGSDVQYHLEHAGSRVRAHIMASFSTANIAVAPHLAEELSSFGIRATVIPSLTAASFRSAAPSSCSGAAVLVYLPSRKPAFYGEAIVDGIIRTNPDLTFIIVADEVHRFRGIANVESLGWVSDMTSVYDRVGCLLRITEHDGLPRMVIEALLLGKHVIYSNNMPGTWLARTYEEVQQALQRYRGSPLPNKEGMAAVQALFTTSPEAEFAREIREAVVQPRLIKRIFAFFIAIYLILYCRIEKHEEKPSNAS